MFTFLKNFGFKIGQSHNEVAYFHNVFVCYKKIGIVRRDFTMKISKEEFEKFWMTQGQYLRIKNPERLKNNLLSKIEELGDSVVLDEYVMGLRTGKESTRVLVVKFYDYLINKGRKIQSTLFQKKFYDYPFERQLEIAKFLHEPKKTSEIQEKFDIDKRTVQSDLRELEEGIQVLGSTIMIKKEKKGRSYYYKTTLHPVFLPLNLTEIYALTVYMNHMICKNDPNAQMIRNISERIKMQLSDYAFSKLFPGEERNSIKNHYLDDEELARQRDGIYMYLMKSGQKCKFIWQGNEYFGNLVWKEKQYKICLEDGKFLDAELNEVDFIVEELDYQ